MANKHTSLNSLFSAIAGAIRTKKSTTETIIADNFADEINSIYVGADATAQANHILNGKTVCIQQSKITGTMPNRSDSSVTGIGYSSSYPNTAVTEASELAVVTNTDNKTRLCLRTGAEGYYDAKARVATELSNLGDATAEQVLSGKTFTSTAGLKQTGTIASKAAATYTPGTSDQTIAAGQYLSGDQTIKGDANLVSANILSGKTIFGVSGNSNVVNTSAGTAAATDILSGKIAFVDGKQITGSIASQAAQTITPGTSDKTIAAGKYLSGTQTIKGDANLKAANIKSGVSIFGISGTLSSGATVKTGTTTVSSTTKGATFSVSWSCGSKPSKAFFICPSGGTHSMDNRGRPAICNAMYYDGSTLYAAKASAWACGNAQLDLASGAFTLGTVSASTFTASSGTYTAFAKGTWYWIAIVG